MSLAGRSIKAGLAMILGALALAVAGSAEAVADSPPLTIGTVTVEDGTAIVTGVVENVDATLQADGAPLVVGPAGEFLTAVDLDAEALVLTLNEAPGRLVELRIPVDVLLATGGQGILNDLIDAGISIDAPIDGFRVVDGQMPVVEGRVLDRSSISVLEINGVSVLPRLGSNGTFSVVPGSSSSRESVTVVATGRNGVTQTNRYSTTSVRSTIATRSGTSVSAAGAQGLVITKVRLDTRRLAATKRFAVVVTVADRRGYLVRGASLRQTAMSRQLLVTGQVRAGFTNRLGQARFTYQVRPAGLTVAGKGFLTVTTRASTERSAASLRVKLRLPARSSR